MKNAVLDGWLSQVRADLAVFNDPGSVIEHDSDHRGFSIDWHMSGRSHNAYFSISVDDAPKVQWNDGTSTPYRTFLAELSDLRRVAEMILKSNPEKLYIDSKAREDKEALSDGESESDSESAVAILDELIGSRDTHQTNVIMLRADAGSGKTRILKELVRRHAEDYINGCTDKLLLYINAQGRALARLDEALATELQDLRAGLTYHAVPMLCRYDLLVPVIDGFDELLGISGYAEAFGALGAFLEKLGGRGQLLASARSVYFEEEFVSRATKLSLGNRSYWSYSSVTVLPWSEEERDEYVEKRLHQKGYDAGKREELSGKVRQSLSDDPLISGKPLFINNIVDLVDSEYVDFSSSEDVIEILISGFMEREIREKLLDRDSNPMLEHRQMERLFGEVALEMWSTQTRELTAGELRDVVDMVLDDESVSQSVREVVVSRSPSLAFFSQADQVEPASLRISFEHESFFFEFLSRIISAEYLCGDDNLRLLLSGSPLPDDVATRSVQYFCGFEERSTDQNAFDKVLDRLGEAGVSLWLHSSQIRENAGRLAASLLCRYPAPEVCGKLIHSLVFLGGNLKDVVFRDCTFRDVEFHRTQLSSTKFINCKVEKISLYEPKISRDQTRLQLRGLKCERDVTGLVVDGDVIYDPEHVARALRDCGADVSTDPGAAYFDRPRDEFVSLVGRLVRAYQRRNPICMSDPHLDRIFDDRSWPKIYDALRRHNIIILDGSRAASGSRKEFLRRQYRMEDVMAALGRPKETVEPAIRAFWQELAE